MKGFSGFAYVLSEGVLMWYCFSALSKVAIGNTRQFMPEFRDFSDLVGAARLGLAALVISTGPLFALVLYVGASELPFGGFLGSASTEAVVHARPAQQTPTEAPSEGDEGEEPATESSPDAEGATPSAEAAAPGGEHANRGPMLLGLFALALLWKLVYTPVALTVAALSRSILSTLNPVIGIQTIVRMGSVYWQCLAIYTPIAIGQALVGLGLAKIPLAGGLVRSFVDAYAYLVIGCLLGLAVFKKARELGWD
jgi:hypothetical protein